jgi:hypothetical protein
MGKIPVGETISGAYGFAFAGFLTVLGTVWLPILVLLLFDAGVVYLISPDLPGRVMHGDFDMSLVYSYHRVRGLLGLANFIIGAMITVGLQERALGRVQGPTFFYFSLGAPVWRLIGAYILAIIALVIVGILTAVVAGGTSYAAVHFVPRFGWAIAFAIIIAAVCWFIYACVRLTFLLPAVVVAEDQIGLPRAWELGGGNFWRMFAVAFVVFVPFWIGLYYVWNALIGPFIPWDIFSQFHRGMTPDQVNDVLLALTKRIFAELRAALPIVVTLAIIQELLVRGLANGMIAKAYLGVTGKSA